MYLEIDEGFDSHPKTVRLCRVMGDVNAGQYMIRIWAWACRSAQDGDLSGMEAADIEKIANYSQMDGKLFRALSERWSPKFGPWIDVDGQTVRLHGWDERQGAAISRMEKNAARMRAARGKKVDERANDVQSTCDARSLHVKSSPVQTSQDKTSPDPERDSRACVATSLPNGTVVLEQSNRVKRPTGYDLLTMFGHVRQEVFPGTIPWHTARDSKGDAGSFAETLTEDDIADLRKTMRLALEKIRDGVGAWGNPELAKDVSFAFGKWKSSFTGLREELQGRSPKTKPADKFGQPAAKPRSTPVVER